MDENPIGKSAGNAGNPSRRTVLTTLGGIGLGGLIVGAAGCASDEPAAQGGAAPGPSGSAAEAPSCILSAETTEGPYYLDLEKLRSDITEGKPGTPLELRLGVVDATSCQPIGDATVDIWHCDSGGYYSGYTSTDPDVPFGGGPGGQPPGGTPPPRPSGSPPSGGPRGGGHVEATDKLTFLRGVQKTDAEGVALFQTVYPGWYAGRAVHIHVKVHVSGNEVHTGQLFFPDALTDEVYKAAPYNKRTKTRDTLNTDDHIYGDSDGAASTLEPVKKGKGYTAEIKMGVKLA